MKYCLTGRTFRQEAQFFRSTWNKYEGDETAFSMTSKKSMWYVARTLTCLTLFLLISIAPVNLFLCTAQTVAEQSPVISAEEQGATNSGFRLEKMEVAGGVQLLTIFGRLNGLQRDRQALPDVPLVSILRDTLGDDNPENDRLRYVWMLTYAKPGIKQRIAAAIPFLYNRVGNQQQASKSSPPPIIDLAATDHEVWNKIFWTALQNIFLDPYEFPVKSSTRNFRQNLNDYRKSHLIRALAILSLYQAETDTRSALTEAEMREVQARLMLTDKIFGGIVDETRLQHVYQKRTAEVRDIRGHNWELLRQRAEAEALYFEPLEMPDGSATHALLWVARPDLESNRHRRYDSRFLNIANPWRDERLRDWKGFSETRFFDAENQPVSRDVSGARAVEMIPLALYGLDHPKIPILLVDFRSRLNPKEREMSRRVLQDVTRNLLGISGFGDLPFFLSRTIYDFVTGRRGMDLNQPSRLRSYSQLKLLLSLDATLDPQLRDEISSRLERVSLNPLENDLRTEVRLARGQYEALVAYAKRPDGLAARIDRDRRAEMVPLKHGRAEQVLFRLGNLLSFGFYTHREKATPELSARLEMERRLAYHGRFLREVAKSGPRVEVVWNIDDVRRSLLFIVENGTEANRKIAGAAARIFAQTEDTETRQLCLKSLYRINNETAKNALLRIYQDPSLEARWREQTAEYLRRAVHEEQRIAPADAKAIVSVIGQ
jgi:hypothetical protein